MRPALPVPSDVYESTFAVTGTPSTVAPFGASYLVGSGVNLYPVVQSVTLDALGNGSVVCTASVTGIAGVIGIGTVLTWSGSVSLNSTATCTASAISPYGIFARQLATLIGPATQAKDGSLIAEDYRMLSHAITDAESTLTTLLGDMFPDTATDLVGRWEIYLGIISNPSLSLATRQANLLAKWRALFGGQPKTMTAAIQTLDLGAAIQEWTTTQIQAGNSNNAYNTVTARRVFLFSVIVSATAATTPATLTAIESIISQMMPAYSSFQDTSTAQGSVTAFGIGTGNGFKCDSAGSLTDQTLLSQ